MPHVHCLMYQHFTEGHLSLLSDTGHCFLHPQILAKTWLQDSFFLFNIFDNFIFISQLLNSSGQFLVNNSPSVHDTKNQLMLTVFFFYFLLSSILSPPQQRYVTGELQ